MSARRFTRSPWPLFAAIATIAGWVWLLDLRKHRIRRLVKQRPAEAQLPLHDERDIAWADKSIELIETAEEAVVRKSAYVAEEVVISKTGIDRVETVRETVRRQDLEVEKIPASKGQTSPN